MLKYKSVLIGVVVGVIATYIAVGTDFGPLVMNQLHVIDMKIYVIIGLVCMILLIVAIAAGVIRWMAEVLCVFGEVAGIGVGAWLKGNFGKRSK